MIRTLYKSDLPHILRIEEAVHITPWTIETFDICFREGYIGWLAEQENKIIGFVIVSLHREECHILNLCVDHPHQHQGWGEKLMNHALSHAKSQGISIAYLEVRRSNSRAISLYRKMEFQLVGERKNYYPSPAGHEDALIFAKPLKVDFS